VKLILVTDIILIAQLIDVLKVFSVLFVKVVTMEPVLEQAIERSHIYFPLLNCEAYRNRMAFDYDKE